MQKITSDTIGLVNKRKRRIGVVPDPLVEAIKVTSDASTEDLLNKTLEILRREVKNLLIESSDKKLTSNSSRDLVNYVKLLTELNTKQEESLKALSDDDLKKMAKK